METAQLVIMTQPPTPPNINSADEEGKVTLSQCYGDIINAITVSNTDFCQMTFDVTVDEVPRLTIPVELKGLTGLQNYNFNCPKSQDSNSKTAQDMSLTFWIQII